MEPERDDGEGSGHVTADIDAGESATESMDSSEGAAGARVVGAHLTLAILFFIVAIVGATIAAYQLAVPGSLDGIAFLSYGRLTPIFTSLFLYGWLTLGFLAAVHHVLPRVAGRPLVGTIAAYLSMTLIAIGVVVGSIGIAFGHAEGRPYLEMPLYADAFIIVGLVLAAFVATRNVAPSRERMVPAQWYMLAATWWAVLTVVIGNVPGVAGFAGAMQTGFFRAAITGFWFAAAGIGLIYYLIPRIVGTSGPMRASSLSALGFWSLAVVWASTGPVMFIYGPGPGWYETVGVAFSIGLLVPVLIIVADFFVALRGQWLHVTERGLLSFILLGAFLFVLIPVQNLTQALRTSSAAVQFTEWVPAADTLAYVGAFSLWLFALAYDVKGPGAAATARATWHLRFSIVGLFLILAAMWMGGAVTGFTWAAGANSGEFTSFGDGWAQVGNALAPYLSIRAIGTGIFAFAQILLLFAVIGRSRKEAPLAMTEVPPLDLEIAGEPGSLSWRSLRFGVVALFLLALVLTVLLPSFDGEVANGTVLGDRDRLYPAGSTAAAGRAVYIEEGCYYCHTQEVRPVIPDVGLGRVSLAGDYVHETPALPGVERLGPDLMHVASRYSSTGVLRSRLIDPRGSRSWSIMPSYERLSDEDLDALTTYLMSLR